MPKLCLEQMLKKVRIMQNDISIYKSFERCKTQPVLLVLSVVICLMLSPCFM